MSVDDGWTMHSPSARAKYCNAIFETTQLFPFNPSNRYVEEHIQRTGVAIETQGFSFVTSGRKRESLTVSRRSRRKKRPESSARETKLAENAERLSNGLPLFLREMRPSTCILTLSLCNTSKVRSHFGKPGFTTLSCILSLFFT